MNKKHVWLMPLAAIALSMSFMTSCSDDLSNDDHYKTPDWLKGNAYEVMQKDGNYSIFLKGLDLCGYGADGITAGKSLVTVMAPKDDAFNTFLTEKGYSSIEDMYQKNPDYTSRVIAQHLLYYAFDWDKLVNFRPSDGDAATEDQKQKNAGYYYKHRSHAQDVIESDTVVSNGVATEYKIYHYELYVPVLSTAFFASKGVEGTAAAYDYNYFYPNTPLYASKHSGSGFNVENALVNDTANVITDNGYLYNIDRVLEPLYTIYDELKNNADFSDFYKLYDGYRSYTEALAETNTTLGYVAYMRSHSPLPNIAYEWPISNSSSSAYTQMEKLEREGYNVFAPTNAALSNFFNSYWSAEQGYSNLNDLDPLIKEYFVKQMFTDNNFIALPSEIKKGTIKTNFGTTVNFDPDQIAQNRRKICANGVLYGMDQMTAPAIFSSVAAPAFRDTTYSCQLYVLDGSGLVSSLASDSATFVALMPTNLQYSHMSNDQASVRLYTTINGKELQQYSSESGTYDAMGSSTKKNLANLHLSDNVSELKMEGIEVVNTYTPFTYWFIKDGTITTSVLFNKYIENPDNPGEIFSKLTKIGEYSNGTAYSYGAREVFEPQSTASSTMQRIVSNGQDSEFSIFYQLMKNAKFVSGEAIDFGDGVTYGSGDGKARLVAFIPTDDVIMSGYTAGTTYTNIPGIKSIKEETLASGKKKYTVTFDTSKSSEMKEWLKKCFISTDENIFTDYPYIGSTCKGTFITKGLTNSLTITDTGSALRITNADSSVNVTSKYFSFPFAYTDGCIHFVDGILK